MSDELSLRDEIASVMDAPSTAPGGDSPATAPQVPPTPSESPVSTPPGDGARQDRARDERGRYLEAPKKRDLLAPPADALRDPTPTDAHPKPGETVGETKAPIDETKPPVDETKPAPAARVPKSWKGEARALFASLPAPVRAEITRREQENYHELERSAASRAAVAEMQQVVAPFLNNIRVGHNGDAVGAIRVFLQTDNMLRHGTEAEKARLIADVIKNYNVNVRMLDSTLAGEPVQSDPAELVAQRLRAEVHQQMQPVMSYFQQMQQVRAQRNQELMTQAQSDVEAFGADPAHEYFDQVHDRMGRLMQIASEDGLTLTLQEAYDQAIALDPELSKLEDKRREQQRANAAAEAAQRARRAAASLPSGGAPSGAPASERERSTLREDLERSIAAHAAR